VLPVLYLRGCQPAILRLRWLVSSAQTLGCRPRRWPGWAEAWQAEHTEWSRRDLSDRDYVYLWCDGVHFNIRLEEDRLCCLVIVGVRPDGTKELVAVADGYRQSTEAWADLLRDLRARGMTDPEIAIGDGALGGWAALCDVFPTTGTQRCWVHTTANVLSALPSRVHEDAKTALAGIWGADSKAGALDAASVFAEQFAWPQGHREGPRGS
jgi:putative transposase